MTNVSSNIIKAVKKFATEENLKINTEEEASFLSLMRMYRSAKDALAFGGAEMLINETLECFDQAFLRLGNDHHDKDNEEQLAYEPNFLTDRFFTVRSIVKLLMSLERSIDFIEARTTGKD